MRQFTGSAATRVVETDDPINYAYVDGARATNERPPRPSPPVNNSGENWPTYGAAASVTAVVNKEVWYA